MAQELKVAVIAGVLSFVGAIGGTYFSSQLAERRAGNDFSRQLRAAMLERRLALVDHCSRARLQAPRLKTLKDYRDLEAKRHNQLAAANASLDEFAPKVYTIEMQREYAQIESDQMQCTQMANILFGPKTHAAAQQVQITNWTDVNDARLTALIEAMIDELTYFK